MKELLWNRKGKFIQYLIASFMFIVDHFIQIFTFSIILGAAQQGSDANMSKIIVIAVFAALLVLQAVLAAYMVIASALLYGIAYLFSKKTVTLQEQVASENEHFTTSMSNTFQGLEILKLNRMDDKFLKASITSQQPEPFS